MTRQPSRPITTEHLHALADGVDIRRLVAAAEDESLRTHAYLERVADEARYVDERLATLKELQADRSLRRRAVLIARRWRDRRG